MHDSMLRFIRLLIVAASLFALAPASAFA